MAGASVNTDGVLTPNTPQPLPGGGLLTLSEQFCDGDGGHHLGVLDVIVGESHADGTFVPT